MRPARDSVFPPARSSHHPRVFKQGSVEERVMSRFCEALWARAQLEPLESVTRRESKVAVSQVNTPSEVAVNAVGARTLAAVLASPLHRRSSAHTELTRSHLCVPSKTQRQQREDRTISNSELLHHLLNTNTNANHASDRTSQPHGSSDCQVGDSLRLSSSCDSLH